MSDIWFVYIIECSNGSLYTGITKDLERRFNEHLNGTGAKFFRTTKPLQIAYQEKLSSKSEALKREIEIKKLNRDKKLKLINKKK